MSERARIPKGTRPVLHPSSIPENEQLATARLYFRRGYSLVDAAGNAGTNAAALAGVLTADDHKAHDAVWTW